MKIIITDKKSVMFATEIFCRFAVIIVFLAAALPKLFNISDFAAIINAYEMLPQDAVLPMAVCLPVVEIALAVGLFCNVRVSTYLSISLLIFFIAILSFAIYQGLDIDCGCFGPEDPEHQAFQGLRVAIVRDVVMILFLLYSLWYEKYQKSYNT